MLIKTVLPKAVCSLVPSMTGTAVVTIGWPLASVPLWLPLGGGRVGSRKRMLGWVVVFGKTTGASLMANWPSPKVLATRRFGSPGWATARPVVGSTFPSDVDRSVTATLGR